MCIRDRFSVAASSATSLAPCSGKWMSYFPSPSCFADSFICSKGFERREEINSASPNESRIITPVRHHNCIFNVSTVESTGITSQDSSTRYSSPLESVTVCA